MYQSARAIKQEINELNTLKVLTKVYAEVAAIRMNQKRKEVLYSRDFLHELNIVFSDARRAYLAELKRRSMVTKTDLSKKITLLSHNGKNVAVFIAANTRLYGSLIQRTFEMFMEDVRVTGSEATVVGRVGRTMYEDVMGSDNPYTYVDMPDTEVNMESIKLLVKHLVPYEEIHLYYGKFVNVVRQEPELFSISAELDLTKDESTAKMNYFLFEPTIEAVLKYFEGQIFGTLLKQTVDESQLAKFAARLNAMDHAEQAVSERLKKIKRDAVRNKHHLLNKQMVNDTVSRWRWFGK